MNRPPQQGTGFPPGLLETNLALCFSLLLPDRLAEDVVGDQYGSHCILQRGWNCIFVPYGPTVYYFSGFILYRLLTSFVAASFWQILFQFRSFTLSAFASFTWVRKGSSSNNGTVLYLVLPSCSSHLRSRPLDSPSCCLCLQKTSLWD